MKAKKFYLSEIGEIYFCEKICNCSECKEHGYCEPLVVNIQNHYTYITSKAEEEKFLELDDEVARRLIEGINKRAIRRVVEHNQMNENVEYFSKLLNNDDY